MILAAATLIALTLGDEPAAKPDPNQRVCKEQRQTGTRFPIKTCRTRAEWDAIAEAARRQATESFDKPVVNLERGN